MNELTRDAQLEFQAFLVQHLTRRLSGSSVLAVDQIEAIQSSIYFVLAHATKGVTIAERYESGKAVILAQVATAQWLYQQITTEVEDFQIESLRGTIQELGGFFSSYNMDFAANVEGTIWIDYQLAHPIDTQQVFGIDFVLLFLESLAVEVKFINQFSKPVIRELLTRDQKQLGFDYRKDINNLYELVFNQVMGKLIVGQKGSLESLILTRTEADFLYARRHDQAIQPQLARELGDQPYYQQSLNKFFTKLAMLEDASAMAHFLVLTERAPEYQLELPSNMSATAYTQLLDRVMMDPNPVALILAAVQSPYDLLELVETDISEQTWTAVFEQLDFALIIGLTLIVKQEKRNSLAQIVKYLISPNALGCAARQQESNQSLTFEELSTYSDFNERLWQP